MVLEPNVRVLATKLRACIQKAEADIAAGTNQLEQSRAPETAEA